MVDNKIKNVTLHAYERALFLQSSAVVLHPKHPIMIKDKQLALLLAIIFVSLFLFLGNSFFYTKGEPREAVVALSMLNQSNWILPINNGVDMAYKPPFFHWCVAVGAWLTGGVSEYIARLPSALALALMVVVGYVFFAKRRDKQTAFVMALITLTSFELHRAGTNCRVDMLLSALMVVALYQLFRWYEKDLRGIPWLGILCMSGAFLTKGPVGVILPCLVMGVFSLVRVRRFVPVFVRFLCVGLAACVLPLAWYVAAYREGGDHFLQLVMEENLLRFMGKMTYESHENPAYYNVITVLAGFLPYTLLVLISLFTGRKWRKPSLTYSDGWTKVKQYIRKMDDARLFSLLSFAIIFVFYCIPKSKRSVYLIPIYPFIAYFLAEYMLYLWNHKAKAIKIFGCILSALSLVVLALFAALRFGGNTNSLFTGHHAAENQAFAHALQTAPLGVVGALSLVALVAAALWFFYHCRTKELTSRGFYGMFALVFALYFAMDGFFIPTVLNVKSDKATAEHIAKMVPEGKIYACYSAEMTGNPMRQFSLDFYLNDRIMPFEAVKPSEGYLIADEEDVDAFLKDYSQYQLKMVYDSQHRSCDNRKAIHLYHFSLLQQPKSESFSKGEGAL